MTPDVTRDPGERLHALDAVRGFALLAGIVFHATVSFLPARAGVPLWIVMDNERSVALGLLFHVLHIFRMTTFFLIAGFFAHMMFQRKGAGGFIRDRLKRIAVPLIAGWPILFAAIVAVTIWGAMVMAHGHPLPPPPKLPGFPAFPLTHLWFLYVLLVLYAGTLVLRSVVLMLDRSGFLRRAADFVVERIVLSPVGPALLAIPVAASLYLLPQWPMWFGIPTPDSSLVPNQAALTDFGLAFGLGWLIHRNTALLETLKRRWMLNLGFAIAFTVAELSRAGVTPLLGLAPHDGNTLLYAVLFAGAIWSWTFAMIGMALRFLSGFSPVRRYIADASYWLYLIHLPIVMALQVAVSQLAWPWYAKFAFILGVSFPVMFASYQLMVRYTFIGAILNGRRTRKAKVAEVAQAGATA
jgi:peptidoglycan/LPS O-acetylase OafA/YrhL